MRRPDTMRRTVVSEWGRLGEWLSATSDGECCVASKSRPCPPKVLATGLWAVVAVAVREATDPGCEWLHVDFEDHIQRFYLTSCGIQSTKAGLLRLQDETPARRWTPGERDVAPRPERPF